MKENIVFKKIITKDKSVPVGVLFIPIPNKPLPVLVFKTYLGSFQRIKYYYVSGTTQLYKRERDGYISYWDSEFTENKFPSIVKRHYSTQFDQMIELQEDIVEAPKIQPKPGGEGYIIPISKLYNDYDAVKNTIKPYSSDKLPKGCFELKLAPILEGDFGEMKSAEKKRYKLLRSVLQRCGFIPDERGKGKRKVDKTKKLIDKALIAEYKKMKNKKPLSIKRLSEKVSNYVNTLFSSDPESAEKYSYSDATIRRRIKEYELCR